MIQLRTVLPEDDDFLFEVFASTKQEEMNVLGWGETERAAFLRMQFDFQKRSYPMQYPVLDHHIILYDRQQVGRILIARTESVWQIVDIALLVQYRSNGIGGQLIRDLQQEAATVQKSIRLNVNHSNSAAYRLYTRLGFVPIAQNELQTTMVWNPSSKTTTKE